MQIIPVKEGSALPLPTLRAAQFNAFRAVLSGVPEDVENVQVHFPAQTVTCTSAPCGEWRLYVSPLALQEAGAFPYHVTARTPQGNSLHLGSGTVRVAAAAVNTDAASEPIVPDDTYLRNPATGKWHRLTVSVEDGQLVPEIETEGIER